MHEGGETVAVACLVLGFFLLTFGLYGRVIKDHYLSETLLSTLFGIALGSQGFGVLQFIDNDWHTGSHGNGHRQVLSWFCKIVIGVQVLFAGSTLPSRYLLRKENVQSLAVLIVPVMTLSWLISSFLVRFCFPEMELMECLIVGACIAYDFSYIYL